jgi:predicted DNA-binding transcriptional regulator AlpA
MQTKSKIEQLGPFEELTTSSRHEIDAPRQPAAPCIRCAAQYLSDHEVAARFGISKATVWRWHDNNPDFPRRIKLSPGTSRWKLSELVQFETKVQDACSSSDLAKVKGRRR